MINPKLLSYIQTRDKKLVKEGWHFPDQLEKTFERLQQFKEITVGGRATCGKGSKDISWSIFCYWREIVRKANKCGYKITETNLRPINKWATINRGFWDEYQYTLEEDNVSEL